MLFWWSLRYKIRGDGMSSRPSSVNVYCVLDRQRAPIMRWFEAMGLRPDWQLAQDLAFDLLSCMWDGADEGRDE